MTSRDPVENSAPTGHQITTRSYTEGLRHLRGHSQVDGRRWPNELDVHHVLNVVRRQVHNLSLPGRLHLQHRRNETADLTVSEGVLPAIDGDHRHLKSPCVAPIAVGSLVAFLAATWMQRKASARQAEAGLRGLPRTGGGTQ